MGRAESAARHAHPHRSAALPPRRVSAPASAQGVARVPPPHRPRRAGSRRLARERRGRGRWGPRRRPRARLELCASSASASSSPGTSPPAIARDLARRLLSPEPHLQLGRVRLRHTVPHPRRPRRAGRQHREREHAHGTGDRRGGHPRRHERHERPRYSILLTDGDANNCGDSTSASMQSALNGLSSIRQRLGAKTFVLGSCGGSADNLNQMAQAGGTERFPGRATPRTGSATSRRTTPPSSRRRSREIVNVVGGELGGFSCDTAATPRGARRARSARTRSVSWTCASVTCNEGSACVRRAASSSAPSLHRESALREWRLCERLDLPDRLQWSQSDLRRGPVRGGPLLGSGQTLDCPDTHVCYKNACHLRFSPVKPDAGTSTDGGSLGTGGGGGAPRGGAAGRAGPSTSWRWAGMLAPASRRRVRSKISQRPLQRCGCEEDPTRRPGQTRMGMTTAV